MQNNTSQNNAQGQPQDIQQQSHDEGTEHTQYKWPDEKERKTEGDLAVGQTGEEGRAGGVELWYWPIRGLA